jgi:hypothetical protein
MEHTFHVTRIAATDEEWGRLVLMAQAEEFEQGPYLMLQRSYEDTAEDIRLGQNVPYIEIGNQGCSWYGHVERIDLFRTGVVLQMDAHARNEMDDDGRYEVRFDIGDDQFAELRMKLHQIFDGVDVLHQA